MFNVPRVWAWPMAKATIICGCNLYGLHLQGSPNANICWFIHESYSQYRCLTACMCRRSRDQRRSRRVVYTYCQRIIVVWCERAARSTVGRWHLRRWPSTQPSTLWRREMLHMTPMRDCGFSLIQEPAHDEIKNAIDGRAQQVTVKYRCRLTLRESNNNLHSLIASKAKSKYQNVLFP